MYLMFQIQVNIYIYMYKENIVFQKSTGLALFSKHSFKKRERRN